MPIRVFLISDFLILVHALRNVIVAQPNRFSLVGEATSFKQAEQSLSAVEADITLVDVGTDPDGLLPFINSLHSISRAKTVLLIRQDDPGLQDKAILAGARGVVDRHATPDLLLTALEKVTEGQVWLDRAATGRIFVELSRLGGHSPADAVSAKVALLTEREQKVVAFIARNGSEPGRAIAERLHISESTLRNHLTSIYEKLGVSNRHGLLAYALQNGLAERLGQ